TTPSSSGQIATSSLTIPVCRLTPVIGSPVYTSQRRDLDPPQRHVAALRISLREGNWRKLAALIALTRSRFLYQRKLGFSASNEALVTRPDLGQGRSRRACDGGAVREGLRQSRTRGIPS